VKKLLLLSLVLLIASWASCHFNSQLSFNGVQDTSVSSPKGDNFPLMESWSPVEDLGMFLFFLALCIPLMIVLFKIFDSVEKRKHKS